MGNIDEGHRIVACLATAVVSPDGDEELRRGLSELLDESGAISGGAGDCGCCGWFPCWWDTVGCDHEDDKKICNHIDIHSKKNIV